MDIEERLDRLTAIVESLAANAAERRQEFAKLLEDANHSEDLPTPE